MRKIVIDQLKQVKVGKRIGVGVPNRVYPDRLFYHYGTLLEISNDYVVLDNSKETVQIPLNDIVLIRKEVF